MSAAPRTAAERTLAVALDRPGWGRPGRTGDAALAVLAAPADDTAAIAAMRADIIAVPGAPWTRGRGGSVVPLGYIACMTLDLLALLPAGWRERMEPHLDPATVAKLTAFVSAEYESETVFPPLEDLFTAFRLCPLESTRVLILGQDPYHKQGQAHGLSFSVRPGVAVPPSLRNVYKELHDDLGVTPPKNGDLTGWASQGVLLLNAVLTVRSGKPGSHANQGWEHFTDAAIKALDDLPYPVVFVLWGSYARKKNVLVTNPQHVVLEAGHPSPMNPKGFLGSRPFSGIAKALAEAGRGQVNWS